MEVGRIFQVRQIFHYTEMLFHCLGPAAQQQQNICLHCCCSLPDDLELGSRKIAERFKFLLLEFIQNCAVKRKGNNETIEGWKGMDREK